MHPNRVNVRLSCRCGEETGDFCVRVHQDVPPQLRCTPGGGGGGVVSEICCRRCGRRLIDITDLGRAVDGVVGGDWDRHLQDGAVVIDCR